MQNWKKKHGSLELVHVLHVPSIKQAASKEIYTAIKLQITEKSLFLMKNILVCLFSQQQQHADSELPLDPSDPAN